jgi:hypothetical protein
VAEVVIVGSAPGGVVAADGEVIGAVVGTAVAVWKDRVGKGVTVGKTILVGVGGIGTAVVVGRVGGIATVVVVGGVVGSGTSVVGWLVGVASPQAAKISHPTHKVINRVDITFNFILTISFYSFYFSTLPKS